MFFSKQSMQSVQHHAGMTLLVCLHIVICCLSFMYVTRQYDTYHLYYDSNQLLDAIMVVAAFALVSLLFTSADFSFGYFVGFYFYTIILGYLWLTHFSDFSYNRKIAGLSAAVSTIGFLLPTLFITSPVRQMFVISIRTFNHLLTVLFLLSLTTIAVGASYNFEVVSPLLVSSLRGDAIPRFLGYAINITSSAVLPFLFACFVARRNYFLSAAILLLLLLYYPIAMSKTVLFAPTWLVFMLLLTRIFKPKAAVILSLLVPIFAGVLMVALFKYQPYSVAVPYFNIVNFRMVAVPSSAMDVYNDFFSKHDLTYYCQIRALKSIISCPYKDQLSVVMMHAYPFGGTFNASLFATEGIASVGVLFAPVSVFACGLVVALGNRFSAGLPPFFILVSGAMLPQILLNVALSTTMVTHGAALLFLLWYITPRNFFEQDDRIKISCY